MHVSEHEMQSAGEAGGILWGTGGHVGALELPTDEKARNGGGWGVPAPVYNPSSAFFEGTLCLMNK